MLFSLMQEGVQYKNVLNGDLANHKSYNKGGSVMWYHKIKSELYIPVSESIQIPTN